MSNDKNAAKGDKKKPVKNLKEKRADKKDKRDSKSKYDWHIRSPTSTTGRLFFAAFDQACPYAHSHIVPESFSLNPTAGHHMHWQQDLYGNKEDVLIHSILAQVVW